MWLSVDGMLGKGESIQAAHEFPERLSQKQPIFYRKSRHLDVIEESDARPLKRHSEVRQLDVDPSQCLVDQAQ
ncbi:MAG: hypothetical protein ABSB09_07970 [Acidimicrobiales bacterium]